MLMNCCISEKTKENNKFNRPWATCLLPGRVENATAAAISNYKCSSDSIENKGQKVQLKSVVLVKPSGLRNNEKFLYYLVLTTSYK